VRAPSALVVAALGLTCARAHAERQAGYKLEIPEHVDVVAGAGTLPLAIVVDRGLTVSRDAAVIVDLAPDSAVSIKKRRLGRADAVDPDADGPHFNVALHAETPGDFVLRVRVRAWVCGQKVCRPFDARRNVAISVAPAAPPPASPPTP
jgi:hypothetical protein